MYNANLLHCRNGVKLDSGNGICPCEGGSAGHLKILDTGDLPEGGGKEFRKPWKDSSNVGIGGGTI